MASAKIQPPGGLSIPKPPKRVRFNSEGDRERRATTTSVGSVSTLEDLPSSSALMLDAGAPPKAAANSTNNCQPKKPRHNGETRSQQHGKGPRKRSASFSISGGGGPHKWRKKSDLVPPTKFLLGGNIRDPLNLGSLANEEVNRALNAVTPQSSPLPTPKHRKGQVEVLIPPNINDPLNLNAGDEDDDLVSQLKPPSKKRRNRKRKKRISGESTDSLPKTEEAVDGSAVETNISTSADDDDVTSGAVGAEAVVASATDSASVSKVAVTTALSTVNATPTLTPPATPKEKEQGKRVRRGSEKDRIVSPVVPQPGTRKWMFNRSNSRDGTAGAGATQQTEKKQAMAHHLKHPPSDAPYKYGNYSRYYGYRNPNQVEDPRLRHLKKEWFRGKDVLDLGCNVGHVTLSVARDLEPRRAVGLDIDYKLLMAARANVKHYLNREPQGRRDFPISMPIMYGPLDVPGVVLNRRKGASFPHNVSFVRGNYVLHSDELLETVVPEFDVILCLSTTKWFHLNWGDEGLKRTFKRMFLQLRPGGKLILEAQPWSSYKRKKQLTETIYNNFKNIKFFPKDFTRYLLQEVGFSKEEIIATPHHNSKGFQRPVQLFTKGEAESPSLDSSCPEQSRDVSVSGPGGESEEQMEMNLSESTEEVTGDVMDRDSAAIQTEDSSVLDEK